MLLFNHPRNIISIVEAHRYDSGQHCCFSFVIYRLWIWRILSIYLTLKQNAIYNNLSIIKIFLQTLKKEKEIFQILLESARI